MMTIFGKYISQELVKRPELFKFYFIQSILKIRREFNCTKKNRLILAIDRKKKFKKLDGSYARGYWRDIYYNKMHLKMSKNNDGSLRFGGYKAGRVKDSKFDWETLEKCYAECLELFKNFSDFQVIEIAGVEADDICAVLALKSKRKVTLISHDKDVKALATDKILYYDWYTKKYCSEHMSDHDKLLFYLKGDSADAIPSIKKNFRWKSKLEKFTLQEIFDQHPDENLEERYKINVKLMDLSLENLPKKVQQLIIQEVKKEQGKYNQFKLSMALRNINAAQLTEGDVPSLISRMEEFSLPDRIVESKTSKKYKENTKNMNYIKNRFLKK